MVFNIDVDACVQLYGTWTSVHPCKTVSKKIFKKAYCRSTMSNLLMSCEMKWFCEELVKNSKMYTGPAVVFDQIYKNVQWRLNRLLSLPFMNVPQMIILERQLLFCDTHEKSRTKISIKWPHTVTCQSLPHGLTIIFILPIRNSGDPYLSFLSHLCSPGNGTVCNQRHGYRFHWLHLLIRRENNLN